MMIIDEINKLKSKLEEQVLKKDSYDKIYETSVKIDKLLVKFYSETNGLKKI